jgi:NRPS condensation-like uncharacterized protein
MKFILKRPKRYKVEAFDLWHYYSRRRYESRARMRIDFGGHLDEAALVEALEQSCVTLPLIACGFDTTPLLRPRWVEREGAAREILRVVEASGRREEEVQRALAISLDIYQGPQLRVVLVRDTQQDSLCLVLNHMLCDGGGFKQYLVALAGLYSRVIEGLDPSPPPFRPDRSIRPVLKGFTRKKRLRMLLTPYKPSTKTNIDAYLSTSFAFESGPFSTLTASVSAEVFKQARVAAKAQGFTVNDLFLAAFSLAWRRAFDARALMVPCTMDMRGFAAPDLPMGITNFTSECQCLIQMSSDDTIESVAPRFAEQMEAYKQNALSMHQLIQWNIVSRFLPFRWADWLFWRVFTTYPIALTNAGIIDENCVRFGDVSVQSTHLAGAVLPSPSLVFGMSTFRDELTFWLSVEGDEAARVCIQNVLTIMAEELTGFASRYSGKVVL